VRSKRDTPGPVILAIPLGVPLLWTAGANIVAAEWRSDLSTEVGAAQAQFERSGIRSSQVEFGLRCFCLPSTLQTPNNVRVTVRDDAVTKVQLRGGHDEVLATWTDVPENARWLMEYAPFDRAFAAMWSRIDDVDDASARFDPRTGAPLWFSVNPERSTFDDEATYEWTNFRRLG
jgi:hypothetical protein